MQEQRPVIVATNIASSLPLLACFSTDSSECDDSHLYAGASYEPPAVFLRVCRSKMSLKSAITYEFSSVDYNFRSCHRVRARALRIHTHIQRWRELEEAFGEAAGRIILRPRTLRGNKEGGGGWGWRLVSGEEGSTLRLRSRLHIDVKNGSRVYIV